MPQQYERMTISLYDAAIDERKPPRFTFLPCLNIALTEGPKYVAKRMMEAFWRHLLHRGGYFATANLREAIEPDLERYFLEGIAKDLMTPLQL